MDIVSEEQTDQQWMEMRWVVATALIDIATSFLFAIGAGVQEDYLEGEKPPPKQPWDTDDSVVEPAQKTRILVGFGKTQQIQQQLERTFGRIMTCCPFLLENLNISRMFHKTGRRSGCRIFNVIKSLSNWQYHHLGWPKRRYCTGTWYRIWNRRTSDNICLYENIGPVDLRKSEFAKSKMFGRWLWKWYFGLGCSKIGYVCGWNRYRSRCHRSNWPKCKTDSYKTEGSFSCRDISDVQGEYPIVVANLYAEVLVALCDDIVRLATGKIALAGILVTKEEMVLNVYTPHCSLIHRSVDGDWVSLWWGVNLYCFKI